MVKVKNKKNSNLADKVRSKRRAEAAKKTLNPFEVHVNREKFHVLGRKMKHDRGLPGVSRHKALQKRKETLGVEMQTMNKSNSFVDRRIGEKDSRLTGEERIVARFAAERARQHSRKNIYNLADDVLTHRGQTLEDIEKFDDPRSSDDEDEDGRKFGGLNDDFVAEGHFGGGMLSKTDARDGAKSHKDLIDQLIAESKKRKAEKQKLREQTLDLTEKLDTEWKDLRPIVFKKPREEEKEKEESLIDKLLSKEEKKSEDYDKMMRELRFEKRGTPSDGLQSEEKVAKQQKETLLKLEKDRQERMQGAVKSNINSIAVNKHRSADDLDDNFEFDNEPMYMVAYDKDGKPLLPDHILKENSLKKKKVQFDNEVSDSDDENKEEDEDSEDDESGDESEVDSLKDLKYDDVESESNESSKESNEKHPNAMAENLVENETNAVKTKNNSSTEVIGDETIDKKFKNNEVNESISENSDQSGESSNVQFKSQTVTATKRKSNQEIESLSRKLHKPAKETRTEADIDDKSTLIVTEQLSKAPSFQFIKPRTDLIEEKPKEKEVLFNSEAVDEQIANQIKADLLARKVIMEKAKKELPYTYEMPGEYEQLEELLSKQLPEYQAVILERLIKCYHPSLAENNKELLSKLFAYLLQYVNDIFSCLKKEKDIIKSFQIFDKLAPQIYDLAQMNVMNTKHCLTEVIVEKYEDFKKNHKTVPGLDTLIFFKLVSLIFPTSDFRHPVVTPCLIFMSEILTKCKFVNGHSIARGLFLTALILEYTVLSKRFVPAAINYIRGLIFYSANTSVLNPVQVVPPFKLHSKEAKMLVLEEDCSKINAKTKMVAKDLILYDIDSEFKIRCFSTSINMLKELFSNCNDMETQQCMFEPHIQLLGRVDLDLYPEGVAKNATETLTYMKETLEMKTYTPLAREKKRPKALKLYEPDVQDVFTGSKTGKLSREQAEREKLKHKLRRETKGALREIRRDKAYVGALNIKRKIQSDNIRKQKVKQIFKDASIQQGELNKMKRQK